MAVKRRAEPIATELGQRILDGIYPAGAYAPSTAQISDEYGVAQATARRVLHLLAERGLIVGVSQGRRPRIANPARPDTFAAVIEHFRAAIADGTWSPGTSLPSVLELVQTTGRTRYEVRAALAELERTGEIIQRPGRRRIVAGATPTPDTLGEKIKTLIIDDIREERLRPGQQIASEEAVAKRYEVSRITARRALLELEAEGILARDASRRRVVAPKH